MTTTAPERSTPTVREAERHDLLPVYRIEEESFDQPWPFTAFQSYLGEPGFLVAVDESVVGYVVADVIDSHGRDLGHIKDLAVSPSRRGDGVGTLLLTRALAVLEGEGVASVKLEVRESNETARGLYRSHDFDHRRTLPEYYGDGEDALVLVRAL
ncbi:[SSU ribosomal protein S18P]-alanine acetyltransferase [Halovenus aranensis]|uniref:[SSU ribosomal protein S18P]-alanine acetyltransferase n=1 Tax=Halovenus aranensis TaxID=890420 RepID=A0A1G8YER6_9EURY|nr:ribosomal protein S18-alanine N-acetyltransferase [Halovenus aranensis]SDK01328.1 [SSU ribosomal protein S18P]-alanine acetyltransferase [Halovenus aranensis]